MDLDVLASSVSNLSKGMSKMKELVELKLSVDERDGPFVKTMRSFQKRGAEVIMELKDFEHRVFCLVKEITEYYHGEVSKEEVNPLQIFVVVSDFLVMLDRVCKEVRSSTTTQAKDHIVHFPKGS
ncbi:hypothetical protein HPP92_026749 [Vanilla planifolia]|uniref:FH2 domain-containing protein n=1 Tax=Vanilla planifolia TaxID=51239 RepID=A0A835U5K7_VANPL|nr:hypothetical protein HPP92_026749 [Vanilla planifolia]